MNALFAGDWLRIFHLLGAAQGVFLAVILASKRRNSVANKLLSVLMFVFSLELLTTFYHAQGLDEVWPQFIGVTYSFPLLLAPLLYLYARAVSAGGQVFRKEYLLHLLPFVLLTLYLVPFYAQSGAEKLALLQDPERHLWTPSLSLINAFKFLYSFVYLVMIIVLLKRHRERVRDAFSSLEHLNLTWLRNMIIGGAALWGLSLVLALLGVTGPGGEADPIEGYDDYMALAMAVYIYAIGYLGLRQPEIFTPRPIEPRPIEPPVVEPRIAEAAVPDQALHRLRETAKPRYVKSGMEEVHAQRYLQALLDLMETEKPYQRSDLTLQDLAEKLAISPHNLSEVINTQVRKNFYDFVNGYRVEEVQRRLADPDSAHLTLLAVGLEAGFNSKSSFNAVFKKHVHLTPSEYRKQVVQEVG